MNDHEAETSNKLEAILANPTIDAIDLVTISDPELFFTSAKAQILLPRSTRPYDVISSSEFPTNNGSVWVADLDDEGTIQLHTNRDGARFGQLRTRTRGFLIEDMDNGFSALIELEPDALSKLGCTQDSSPVPKQTFHSKGASSARSACDHEIEVLFAYSTAAQNSGLNINNIADQVIWQSNYASNKSGIGNDISFKKVGTWHFSAFSETNNMFHDRLQVVHQDVIDEREYYGADMVVLLANGSGYGSSQAFAYLIEPTNPDHSGCIVQISYAAIDYAATHEIGHVIGGRHESDPNSNDAHAYQFYDKATIMSSGTIRQSANYAIIPRWSKPSPYYAPYPPGSQPPWYGQDYGNNSCCNVAKKLEDRACIVAAFGDQLNAPAPIQKYTTVPQILRSFNSQRQPFPNPTTSILNFGSQWDGVTVEISLIGGVGKVINRKILDGQLDLANLPCGIYLVKSGATHYKIVKM